MFCRSTKVHSALSQALVLCKDQLRVKHVHIAALCKCDANTKALSQLLWSKASQRKVRKWVEQLCRHDR